MSIGAIITLVRDFLIVGALGFVVWRIYHDGENAVKVADIKAVATQIAANAKQQAQYAAQTQSAQETHSAEIQAVSAAIAANNKPVYIMRGPPSTGSVSSVPAQAASCPAEPVPDDKRAGSDIRPELQAFELRYEGFFATCREVMAQWP